MICLGAIFMLLGGGLSLFDRRLQKRTLRCRRRSDAAMMLRIRVPPTSALVALFLLLLASLPVRAVEPGEMLADAALEARARALSRELRCMVCQNQSIDDSGAPLAHDLRVLVRERLKAGDSDAQVINFLVARYGEFVLLKPRLSWRTAVLWGLPPAVLLIGMAIIVVVVRQRGNARAEQTANLTAAEETRLSELLRGKG